MSNNHSDYRPRSPDLGAFDKGDLKPPPLPPLTNTTPYQYQPSDYYPANHPGLARTSDSYDTSPYFSPQSQFPGSTYFPPAPPATQIAPPQPIASDPTSIQREHSHAFEGGADASLYSSMPRRRQVRSEDDEAEWVPVGGEGGVLHQAPGQPAPSGLGPSLGIDVKTKFPVARIKRIMQADDEVGKVAQATPTAVSKALELFMINLVTKAAAEAKERGSKRVTAVHLKQAVGKDQTYDFLNDIVEKVPDPTAGSHAAKEGSPDSGDGGPPRKRKSATRKKKTESDD